MIDRRSNEDLFDDSRMSFGEHLEELRRALLKALAGVAVGCVLGFLVADDVVQLLERPLVRAVAKFKQYESRLQVEKQIGYVPPEFEPLYQQRQMAPETVHVDPGELAQVLARIRPDFVQNVDLDPYKFRPHMFDLDRLAELCRQLLDPNADPTTNARLKAIADNLSDVDRETLEQIASRNTVTNSEAAIVANILNRILPAVELANNEAFSDWIEPANAAWWNILQPAEDNPLADMKRQLDQKNDLVLRRRLNRALIARTLEPWMPPLQLELAPLQIWRKIDVQPQALSATEPFMIWVKAGVFTGLIVASPWALLQIWLFVAAGLYPHEKKYVYIFLPISLLLFFSGALLAFFFVFEPVLDFLFSFNASMGIAPDIRINEWLSFVMFLPLGFGIAFQLPLVMLFLNRINVFTIRTYLDKWRIAVMIIFVLSMLLTPADPVSMIMMAVPLTVLYFLGIGLCYWFPTPENPYGDVAADDVP